MKRIGYKFNLILSRFNRGFIYAMLICLAVVGCVGCSSKKQEGENGIKVVTTIFPAYDFASQIGMDKISVDLLLAPGTESHSYEPSPQDIIKISESDVFIYVGGENDSWVDDILSTIDLSNIKVIKLMDCVKVVEEEYVEGMEQDKKHHDEHDEHDDDDDEHDHSEWDEHVWTSPVNAIKISEKIKDILTEIDKENNQFYEENYNQYKGKLEKLDQAFKQVIANAKRKELIFGDRFPVRYFTEEYGLKYYAAFPGCSADTEPSAATVAFLINKVKEDNIPVVLQIELSTGNIARTICEETGAKLYTFYACHNLTKEDFKAGKTYLDFMWENVETLKIALN